VATGVGGGGRTVAVALGVAIAGARDELGDFETWSARVSAPGPTARA
jgi:hypothetical protein